MTPGEVKGYAKQALKRKELSDNEKEAIRMLLDGMEAMLAVAPIIAKVQRELENVRDNSSSDVIVGKTGGSTSPNPGGESNNILPDRKRPK